MRTSDLFLFARQSNTVGREFYASSLCYTIRVLKILTSMFSRMVFKFSKEERWGCSPQTPTRVLSTLDPQLAICFAGKSRQAPPAALGLRKVRGLLAQESPRTSEGESSLSPADDSLAFPGCFASGLAALPPGQKHNGTKSIFRVPPSSSGNRADLPNQVTSAIGVQRGRSAWILIQWINISVGRAAALGEILWCRVRGTNRR